MTKEEGFELLKHIVEKEIVHEDYKRVTDLADLYYRMATGDGIEALLKKIETRVTDDEFEMIKSIYRSIIPATLNSTKLPFKKVARKEPDVRDIYLDEKKKVELDEFIGSYWGDKSLEEFLEYAYVDYNYIDPNAFLITEFGSFDYRREKAKPYPFIASSKEAVMYEYKNNILQYLVVKLPIKYMDGRTERDGLKYTMYLGWDTIVFSQVARSEEETVDIRGKKYEVLYYTPKNVKVPAKRFGYLPDGVTKGRTYVSVFNAVIGFLEKTLKIDSELDLSTAMVAFPQRLAYATPCNNQGCNKGYMPDGSLCPVCEGTGTQAAPKGTQDIITLTLPRNADPSQVIDLEKLLIYKSPPIELLKFQKEYLEYLRKSVHAMMFNADLYTRDQVSITATEKLLESDNLNDTLYDFARGFSATWEFVVRDIAIFTDFGEVYVHHKFPTDFKFKGLVELMNELKIARDAGAALITIAAIEDDINDILYFDRPFDLKKIRIKNMINPFRGQNETNIRFIISQNGAPKKNIVLWENFESIFADLEAENKDFYNYSFDKIREKVSEKTDEYISLIESENTNTTML